jgi:dUTP pyrophosphatase
MNIKICKIREGAKLPTRAHELDAGMDIYYCPNAAEKLYSTEDYHVPPKESRLLSTGIKVDVPYGHMLEIKNKSGIASKRQLLVGACVIDPGYSGEVFVNLHNIGYSTQVIEPGDKIAQAVLIPIVHCGVEEVEAAEFSTLYSTRGSGGFGSTGDK